MDHRIWIRMVAVFPALAAVWIFAIWFWGFPEENEAVALIRQRSRDDSEAMHQQKFCAVHPTHRLGDCGVPYKFKIGGTMVFLCRRTCTTSALMNPDRTLKSALRLKAKAAKWMCQSRA